MLRSNGKSLGNHAVSPQEEEEEEEEEERLRWEGFAEKEGFKSGMKEKVGDGKLIITRSHECESVVRTTSKVNGKC